MNGREPSTQDRLVEAALELFEQRGYEQTAVVDITERAGLARRTFFRYFADKREVLFTRTQRLEALWIETVREAPPAATTTEIVVAALGATAEAFEARRPLVARRHAILVANPELQERELMKLTRLARLTAAQLEARGTPASEALVAAELGALVLRLAFDRWASTSGDASLATVIDAVLGEVRQLG